MAEPIFDRVEKVIAEGERLLERCATRRVDASTSSLLTKRLAESNAAVMRRLFGVGQGGAA